MKYDILSKSANIAPVCDVLHRLGVTANYAGFYYVSYAVYLAIQKPERLLKVTKRLYPEVAEHYGTTWLCVERNIRTVLDIAWQNNRPLLEELAKSHLSYRPTAAAFLAILTVYCNSCIAL